MNGGEAQLDLSQLVVGCCCDKKLECATRLVGWLLYTPPNLVITIATSKEVLDNHFAFTIHNITK